MMKKANVTAMNRVIDNVISEISKRNTVTEIDCSDYETLKVSGMMKFLVSQYELEKLGNLSVMKMNMGIMQMATIILTPREKNLPLFSIDYIYIMGKRKGYIEFYDVVEKKDDIYQELLSKLKRIQKKYDNMENIKPSEAWYDNLITVGIYKTWKTKDDDKADKILMDCLAEYLNTVDKTVELTSEEQQIKRGITKEYTNGLISYGGISTDAFKKSLGEEITRDFFDKVLFGTGRINQ